MGDYKIFKEGMKYILATDVGSTTTKARFFKRMENGEWRFLVAGEAPTTVEAPFEDVTLGVRNAVREIEELTEHKILIKDGSGILVPYNGKEGVDLYCTTSSAGGGLQMMVAGATKNITAESANRAALGAGAIVMDVMAINDGRPEYQKIMRIRSLRPDMILVAGGTDGGTVKLVMEIAELLKAADPKPRLGMGYNLPLLFAGNKNAIPYIEKLMKDDFNFSSVSNIRPVLEVENTEPARRKIHEIFMEHVMSHAPGYPRLMNWANIDIMPTPAGEGLAMQLIADAYKSNLLGVGLGGATTNVYSIINERFVRSVSANLGMSYSLCNVLKETGIEKIMRWLPFDLDEADVKNRLMNKMIRPTIIPQNIEGLLIEHAVAREALRLGLEHHKTIATRLKGVQTMRVIDEILSQTLTETYVDMMNIEIIAGTGGLLSHAPRREQSLLILTDAFQPTGVTRIFQDSVFMMPHLGILSTVYPEAAWQIFEKDCLVNLGTVIAPMGKGVLDTYVVEVSFTMPDGSTYIEKLKFGEIKRVKLGINEEAEVLITPHRGWDVGKGDGRMLKTTVKGGEVGIVIDARGRPLYIPENNKERKGQLINWFYSLNLYPEASMNCWR